MPSTAVAQRMPRFRPDDFIQRLEGADIIGLVAVVFLFGAVILAVFLFGLAAIVKALRGNTPEIEELNERLDTIESKIDRLSSPPTARPV
jgi:hypothetical protein